MITLLAAQITPFPVLAQSGFACSALTNSYVKTGVQEVLKPILKKNPALKKLSQAALISKTGRLFLTAKRPDFKAYGYMMLLWFGSKEDRTLVTQTAGKLKTASDRAHFYFIFGLYQIGSKNPETAAKGRATVKQMRKTGLVKFVPDPMWDQLITSCRLSK